ncbi:MAG TPA: hypothetical protein VGP26_28025 [Actinophytocola sp.]|jgi:hypothetical protein|nr:hypothetical protein [Actinophytocola sp.]
MRGRVWTWLLELPPARDAVRREVKVAVDLVMDATEDAQTRQREKHRKALGRSAGERDDLRTRVDDLAAANEDLLETNAALRAEVAELADAAHREARERELFAQKLLAEQEAAATRQWHGSVTDVFCCQTCWAFWFLSTGPDRSSLTVRGPFGRHDEACAVCADPLLVLPAAKCVVFRKRAEDRVSRPSSTGGGTDLEVASAELAAIADGLSRLPKVASRTTAWIAAELTGMPELPAKILDEVATRTANTVPLDGIVAGLRAFVEVKTPHHAEVPPIG